jgi:hypothetical protein
MIFALNDQKKYCGDSQAVRQKSAGFPELKMKE